MLLVLIPVTVGFEFWVEDKDNPLTREYREPAAVVAKGTTATYAGATWKLTKFAIGPAPKGVKLPRGTRLMFATFEVTPRSAKASKRIAGCQFQVIDREAPRVWDALLNGKCEKEKGEYDTVPVPVGETHKVETAFLLPTGDTGKVRPMVVVGFNQDPLEFAR